ncbi:hypothetical protein [Paenibacillus sp. RC67]|uniref:hypothetical protein n=1 Tax=Paenibacillus sp. RC67 TaxID=3039392 RepID=UPI0024ADEA84|nr:hypothetical protein [Paenibacillus sp. RC67]
MLTKLSQVARTYRTNALWHSREEVWKRRSRHTPFSFTPSITSPTIQNDFESFAQAAAQGLAQILLSAVQLRESAEGLAQGGKSDPKDETDNNPSLSANEQETTSHQLQVEELIQHYSALHKAIDSASQYINSKTVQEALGKPYSELLAQPGIRQRDDAASQMYELIDLHLFNPLRTSELAANLSSAAGRLLAHPPEQLLDIKQPKFKSITNYHFRQWDRSKIHTYFSISFNGMLVNQYL